MNNKWFVFVNTGREIAEITILQACGSPNFDQFG